MLYHGISLSVLILVILLLRAVFRKRVPQRLMYALWLAAAVRLVVPVPLYTVDVPELFPAKVVKAENGSAAWEHEAGESDPPMPSVMSTPEELREQLPPEVLKYPPTVTKAEPPVNVPPVTEPADEPTAQRLVIPRAWTPYLIWAAGSVTVGLWFGIGWVRQAVRFRRSRVFLERAGGRKVYRTACTDVPCLFCGAVYLTPEADASEARDLILRHELTHYRHGDGLWSLLRCAAVVMYWWNPLVWAGAILSKRDGELACDEAVAAGLSGEERKAYALAIIDAIPEGRTYGVGLGTPPVKERIRFLASRRKYGVMAAILALVLLLGGVGCTFASFSPVPAPLTLDNIKAQKGFTVTAQEIKEITLTLPVPKLPLYEQLAARERKNEAWESEEGIPVYDDGVTKIALVTVGIAGEGGDREYLPERESTVLEFTLSHTLPEAGTILSAYRFIHQDTGTTYTSRVFIGDGMVTSLNHSYGDAVTVMGVGAGERFCVYIDGDVYWRLEETATFDIMLNAITYERGNEVRAYHDSVVPLNYDLAARYSAVEERIGELVLTYAEQMNARSVCLDAIAALETFRSRLEEGDSTDYEGGKMTYAGERLTYLEAGEKLEEQRTYLAAVENDLADTRMAYASLLADRRGMETAMYPDTDNIKSTETLYGEYFDGKQSLYTLMKHEGVQNEAAAMINMVLQALRHGDGASELFDPEMIAGLHLSEGAVIPPNVTAEDAFSAFEQFELDADTPCRFVVPLSETERLLIGFTVTEPVGKAGITPTRIWNEGTTVTEPAGVEFFLMESDDPNGGRWAPAATYGNVFDGYAYTYYDSEKGCYVTSIRASSEGVRYEVLGWQEKYKMTGDYTAYKTYRVTSEDLLITDITEVSTITKETVLAEGVPYYGELEGEYIAKNMNENGDYIYRSIQIHSDGTMTVMAGLDGTDAGGSYEGTYTYQRESGTFKGEFVMSRYSNGEHITSAPMTVEGQLLEYGGFVHFVCTASELYDLSPEQSLPITVEVTGA